MDLKIIMLKKVRQKNDTVSFHLCKIPENACLSKMEGGLSVVAWRQRGG